MSPSDDTPAAPLSGVTVVDLSRYLPGPFAAHLLASLGARVLKVEEPTLGDPVRFAPPFVGGRSALAAPLLAGVESVALDLKKPAARAVLEDLLEDADVLLESSRPGTLARWGLEPETLRRRFPRLVICSLSGWGQDGPVAGRSGHDLTYQAVAGTLAPTATMPAHPWADLVGGWSMCGSVLAALVERGRTGAGTWIDAALFDAAVHANLLGWAGDADRPRAAGEPLTLSGALPCYDLYRTADGGYLALALLEPHFWQRFCDALGRKDLRRRHLDRSSATRRDLARLVAARSREQWATFMAEHDLPGEPVLSAAEASRHPQLLARGVLRRGADGLPRLAFPARFDGHRPRAGDQMPELGASTSAVLAEYGADGARKGRKSGVGARFSLKRWWMRRLAGRSA
ncbi:MAG: CoA transferase [Acidobacteria bacterium]|nr:CoA transferase [Acidobacteriota bacterium]